MTRLTSIVLSLIVFCAMLPAQKVTMFKQNSTGTVTVSATPVTLENDIGGMTASFEEVITGSPTSSSIVIRGCKLGTSCDVLETYTGNATSIRAPAIGTIYDYFTVTPTWSGGTSVKVVVNYTVTISRNGGGGGGGGAVNSVFGRVGVVTAQTGDYSCAQVTGCGSAGYSILQLNATPLTQRGTLNFSSEFSAADDAGNTRTNVGITSIAESKIINLVTDLAAKEVTANKDTDVALAANSDTRYPSQKAIKAYVDGRVGGYATVQGNGTPATQRSVLNFGPEFSVADNVGSTRTDISMNAIAESKVTNLVSDLAAKFNLTGGTVSGATTFSSDLTIGGQLITSGPFTLDSTWPGVNPSVSLANHTRLGFGSNGKLGRSLSGDAFAFYALENADTTGNATTSTKFATVPTLCGTGNAPRGVDEFGNPVGCFASSGANVGLSNLSSVSVNISFLPGVDNTIDIGSSTKRWRNGLFGSGAATGSAAVPAFGGLTFGAISAPASPSAGTLNTYALSGGRFNDKDSSGVVGTTVVPINAATHKFFCTLTTAGVLTDCQPAIADLSDGANVFSTGTNANSLGAAFYCSDAGSTDAYACALSPTIASGTVSGYTTGIHYRFKANTINTGPATINFNAIGARTIKKVQGAITTDLSDGDILAGQIVEIVYDGTNMQMVSQLGNAPAGGVASVFGRTGAVVANTGDYTATQVGLGSVSNDTQTKAAVMPNTVPSAGQVPAGNAGGTAYAPVSLSGDASMDSAGAVTLQGNAVKATSAAGAAKQLCLSSGATKTCTYVTYPSEPKVYLAANCAAAAGASAYSYATGWTPTCRAGTNNLNGVLQAIPSTGGTAYIGTWEIPLDWDSTVQPFVGVYYGSGANTSGTVIWTISSGCTKSDGSVTDDPTWVAESAMGTQTMAAASRQWRQTAQFANVTSGNNCVAGGSMYVKLVLSGTAASAVNLEKVTIGSAGRLITASQAN